MVCIHFVKILWYNLVCLFLPMTFIEFFSELKRKLCPRMYFFDARIAAVEKMLMFDKVSYILVHFVVRKAFCVFKEALLCL